MSPYLNKTLRSLAEATSDRNLARLRTLTAHVRVALRRLEQVAGGAPCP